VQSLGEKLAAQSIHPYYTVYCTLHSNTKLRIKRPRFMKIYGFTQRFKDTIYRDIFKNYSFIRAFSD
jgi:hypothetical protein